MASVNFSNYVNSWKNVPWNGVKDLKRPLNNPAFGSVPSSRSSLKNSGTSPLITPPATSIAGVLGSTSVVGMAAVGVAGLVAEAAKAVYRANGYNPDMPASPSTAPSPEKPKDAKPSVTPVTPKPAVSVGLAEGNAIGKELVTAINEGFVLLSTVLYEGFIANRDNMETLNAVVGQICNEISLGNDLKGAYEEAHLNNTGEQLSQGSANSGIGSARNEIERNKMDSGNAYNELTLENQLVLNANLEALVGVLARTSEDLDLVTKKLDYYTKETTEIQLDNFGDNIPALSPQMYKSHYYATAGKKHSDENTFELDDDDYNSMFSMPDLSELLKYPRITEYLSEVTP